MRLWHGTDDPKVPVALTRRLAVQLPDGHFAAFAFQEETAAEQHRAGIPICR
ncbi:hypothetical protein [Streptosporangium saharense]|uniref:Uncharacterized protein n=1 Tax=Streptosporangium saharense TaxID=1706840 RepID=A0A7W7VPA6_9ACTN|nr:hypothetical protein [Streptosporangium saharense]MBB4917309.1 hypothetical protein [Streptosporangium saharense]